MFLFQCPKSKSFLFIAASTGLPRSSCLDLEAFWDTGEVKYANLMDCVDTTCSYISVSSGVNQGVKHRRASHIHLTALGHTSKCSAVPDEHVVSHLWLIDPTRKAH